MLSTALDPKKVYLFISLFLSLFFSLSFSLFFNFPLTFSFSLSLFLSLIFFLSLFLLFTWYAIKIKEEEGLCWLTIWTFENREICQSVLPPWAAFEHWLETSWTKIFTMINCFWSNCLCAHERAGVGRPPKIYFLQLCTDTRFSLEDLSGVMNDRGGLRETDRQTDRQRNRKRESEREAVRERVCERETLRDRGTDRKRKRKKKEIEKNREKEK